MDAPVEFLLNYLETLPSRQAESLPRVKDDLKLLVDDLKSFNQTLKEASQKYIKDEILTGFLGKTWEMVYDIEDIVEACITQIRAPRKSKLSKSTTFATLLEACNSIRRNQLQTLLREFRNVKFTVADDSHGTVVEDAVKIRQQMNENIVGFDKEAHDFINILTAESEELKIASIVGMGGVGKTTFAKKIYDDSIIEIQFLRIWVDISQNFDMKRLLLQILSQLKATTSQGDSYDEMIRKVKSLEIDETISMAKYDLVIHEMIRKVKSDLENVKFIIVMDDIWTFEAWNAIKEILPMRNKWGRVLVTTRLMDVGRSVSTIPLHHLRFLTDVESWDLLQYEIYGRLFDVPPELVGIGQVIAAQCNGLPIVIRTIGGILREMIARAGGNTTYIKEEWIKISERGIHDLDAGDPKEKLTKIISLAYERLPHNLRNCFLYLGVFPEDAPIPVNKIIRLWIAEGFIPKREEESLEKTALDCLNQLINQSLVMVSKKTVDGNPKICRVHDLIRDYCKSEAEFRHLNLFQEISKSSDGVYDPHDEIDKIRRLSIHSHVLEFFSTKPVFPKARSFLCFHESPMSLIPTDVNTFTKGFNLLRVYDAENIRFPKIPIMLVQILYLRYLTLAVDQCTSLPDVIAELVNLQTLIVNVSSSTLDMKADIWKMGQLRHLETKASITLMKDGRGEGGKNLQTLGRLSPESCTPEFLSKAKNLITLGVQGDLTKLQGCFKGLDSLNKLKLVHVGTGAEKSVNPFSHLTDAHSFPKSLKILVLRNTCLDWRMMSLLSKTVPLEVLKLKENTFRENHWDATDEDFPNLKCLHIERTNLVNWSASQNSFPALSSLVLIHCEQLNEVPAILYNSLEMMSLTRVTRRAVSSAEANVKEKQNKGKSFKLVISPADKIRMS